MPTAVFEVKIYMVINLDGIIAKKDNSVLWLKAVEAATADASICRGQSYSLPSGVSVNSTGM